MTRTTHAALIERKDDTEIGAVKRAVDQLCNTFESFKSVNDARLKEVEKKGAADVLTKEHLDRIQNALDTSEKALQSALEAEKKAGRARLSGEDQNHGMSEERAEYKKHFNLFLRKGVENGLAELQAKAMSVGSDGDGGYLVLPERSSVIMQQVVETSPIRQLASVMSISTDSYEQPRRTGRASTGGWVSEMTTVVTSATPTIGMLRIPVHAMRAAPYASQNALDDMLIDVEAWLGEQLADEFSFLENTAFVTGMGVGQPTGFLSYANGTGVDQIEQIASGTSGAVTADGLINLQCALKDQYQPNATFVMNRLVKRDIRKLKDSTGSYLWEPGVYKGLPQSIPDMLLGKPAVTAADMPVAAANSLSVAYGDFKQGYTIVDRMGIRVLRDPFTAAPSVRFLSTKRVGGAVTQSEALKLQKLA